jgi:type IV pilus assembly protein PilC
LRSLEVAERALGNHVFKRTLEKARGNLRNGRGFAEALGSDVFPLMMVKMIRVGEEAGSLEEMLYKAAAFYETEIEIAQERLLSLIEPAMIIVMALIIGFIVVSIVIPMFSIYNLY